MRPQPGLRGAAALMRCAPVGAAPFNLNQTAQKQLRPAADAGGGALARGPGAGRPGEREAGGGAIPPPCGPIPGRGDPRPARTSNECRPLRPTGCAGRPDTVPERTQLQNVVINHYAAFGPKGARRGGHTLRRVPPTCNRDDLDAVTYILYKEKDKGKGREGERATGALSRARACSKGGQSTVSRGIYRVNVWRTEDSVAAARVQSMVLTGASNRAHTGLWSERVNS